MAFPCHIDRVLGGLTSGLVRRLGLFVYLFQIMLEVICGGHLWHGLTVLLGVVLGQVREPIGLWVWPGAAAHTREECLFARHTHTR